VGKIDGNTWVTIAAHHNRNVSEMLNTCLIAAFIGLGGGVSKVLAIRQKSPSQASRIGTGPGDGEPNGRDSRDRRL